MEITKIEFKVVRVKLKEPFKVAFIQQDYLETVMVQILTDEGLVGLGEAAPFAPVTGETLADVQVALEQFEQVLIGENPLLIERMHRLMNQCILGRSAAKAGIDIALYDLLGKKAQLPLYQLLGGSNNQVQTDMTIGIDTAAKMAEKAQKFVAEGYRILKIKVGINPQEDIAAIAAISKAVGPEIILKLDANQGWNPKVAIQTMKELEKYNVYSIEQPLPAWNVAGNKLIRESISQDLMLDESVHSPQDAFKAIQAAAVDIVNIKLMKSAGLFSALEITAVAESAGIPCMIGCMAETRLGIAAAASLAAAKGNIVYADLDSYTLLDELPDLTGGFTTEGDILTLSEEPGLGIHYTF